MSLKIRGDKLKIQIKVIPKSRKVGIEEMPDGSLKVKVSEPPEDGKANAAVVKALAEYYQLPKSAIAITHGLSGRNKTVEVSRKVSRL